MTPQVGGAASAHQRRSKTAKHCMNKNGKKGGKNSDLKWQEKGGGCLKKRFRSCEGIRTNRFERGKGRPGLDGIPSGKLGEAGGSF